MSFVVGILHLRYLRFIGEMSGGILEVLVCNPEQMLRKFRNNLLL